MTLNRYCHPHHQSYYAATFEQRRAAHEARTNPPKPVAPRKKPHRKRSKP